MTRNGGFVHEIELGEIAEWRISHIRQPTHETVFLLFREINNVDFEGVFLLECGLKGMMT
jgi:hypothetical protein